MSSLFNISSGDCTKLKIEACHSFAVLISLGEKRMHPEVTCKGSIALGSGCGHCSRCLDERSRLDPLGYRNRIRLFLLELLKSLETVIPPPANSHHAITYAQYGSDETGWTDRIALQVNKEGVFHCVFIDDEDFDQPISQIVNSIVECVNGPGEFQKGVGLGQYIREES